MQATQRTAFTTAEGQPFEVVWNDPAHAQYLWRWNQDHHAEPMSPLEEWIWQHPAGRLRAYEEAGIDAPPMFRGFEVHNGFQYVRATPLAGEELRSFVARSRALAAAHGGAGNVWPRFALPRIEAACARMRAAPVETPCRSLAAEFNCAFHMTHVAGMGSFLPLTTRLAQLLTPSCGADEAALLTQEAGQGSDNATVASDRAVARLAELAATNPSVAQAVRAGRVVSREEAPGADAFFDALDEFLDSYGDRAQTWGIDHPTLREEPAFAWGMIRAALATGGSPDERRKAGRTREMAIARIREKLAGEPERLAEALAIAEEMTDYVTVREGRALWQLMSGGILRLKLMEKGDSLVSRGVVGDREDIRFLLPDEVDPLFEHDAYTDLRAVVAERRGLHEARSRVVPPRYIAGDESLLPAAAPAVEDTVTGLPGARGQVRARARVVMNLDDAGELEPGEVLVCVLTSPPWTPLFGLASAIVTDSGMALSHPAIAAREYGIPAVVGAGDATTRIRTGDLIEVDGDAGVVRIVRAG